MNTQVIQNYSRLKPSLFFFPIILLLAVVLFLFTQNALNAASYVYLQKDVFYYINSSLGEFPDIQYNLTQLGDALIMFSLLAIFIIHAPTVWESLISASLISLIVSSSLKNIFAVPRPAAMLDVNSFIIIGQKLPGHSSLPSGHSITIFTTLTVIIFAFMPQKSLDRMLWIFLLLVVGITIALTRVAVGAHYPLDVLVGSTLGYLSGLAGIFFSRKYRVWAWVADKKYYPIIMSLLLGCGIALSLKINDASLPIFFLAIGILIVTLYKMLNVYLKK